MKRDNRQIDPLKLPFFDSNLTYQIIHLGNLLTQRTARLTTKYFNLNVKEWWVLAITRKLKNVCAADIITVTGLDKTSVSRAITHVHKKGLIELRVNNDDRRKTLLFLTRKGCKLCDKFMAIDMGFEMDLKSHFNKKEQQLLFEFMLKITHLVEMPLPLLNKSASDT